MTLAGPAAASPLAGRMLELPPVMYHFADAANERSIRELGLLSTAELLRRRNVDGPAAAQVFAHRPADVELPSGERIRDQAPMPPAALASCLDPGVTPQDWYRLVNRHVFFWLSTERVQRHGKALRKRAQLLLTVDTAALLAVYEHRAFVTPFNIGNARRKPAPRGPRTLCPVTSWRADGWKLEARPGSRPRPSSHPPVELLIDGGVPDIHRFVTHSEIVPPW